MPRDIPVGNGTLLVAFNKSYEICDIYYPHVGMENHSAGHPFRFGVWVDGEFSWVRSDGWNRSLDYQDDTLVTDGTQTQLYSETHFNRAKFFEQVHAFGADGDDTAVIHDAVLVDGQVVPADASYIVWLYDFEELQLHNSPPGSGDSVVDAVDEILTAYK